VADANNNVVWLDHVVQGPITDAKLAADIMCKDPELAFNTMERMTRNIRTFCPDHEGVRLGMMLCLVGHMLPDADIWCNGTSKRRCLPTRISLYERLLHGRYIPPRPTGGLATARCLG
jgi:hypothetical protein